MAGTTTISSRALEALVAGGLITQADATAAVESARTSGVSLARELEGRGLVTAHQVAKVLEDELGVPRVDLESYAPDDDALAVVPGATARSARVLPLFEIEGMLTVAIGDPMDVFALDELGAALGCEVEAVLAEAPAVASAIDQYYPARAAAAPAPASQPQPSPAAPAAVAEELEAEAPTAGALSAVDFFEVLGVQDADASVAEEIAVEDEVPVATEDEIAAVLAADAPAIEAVAETPASDGPIDLDVLAVADERRVAALVSDILNLAASRGASRIHVLPYKNDFFVVFRIKGRLEKVASAPLSLQNALVEGFKVYAKLGAVPAQLPALGRIRAEIGGRTIVLTVSAVPTVAGQRLVVSLSADRDPRPLEELGMSDAEVRAMHAMVERGRGVLLVAAPVAGGRSTTYYALLAHAAAAGKTVYSVERSIDYEIPAVAQVLVNPGSPVGAAAYMAAGLRQDTDVIAIDSMQSVEEVHLAIEAAGLGKLVIATFAGSDVAAAVRRMLDLGAEPVSLASALTLGVGQRVVRTNCEQCSADDASASAKKLPGLEKGATPKVGSGCDACGDGFGGATGIFEVLPFTESVRGAIAADGDLGQIEAAARAAGMRPMTTAGLARVSEGVVSAAELDRVLRLTEQR